MKTARGVLAEEHGGAVLWKVMLNQAEYQTGPEGAGYGWDAEAWIGGDLHRLVVKTEGQGTSRDGLEDAEWQALYSRAIGPYTDLQGGIRQDVGRDVSTYAAFGIETILPYWFKVDAAFFISSRGDGFARLEGSYDFFLTQRLALQPDLELNLAMQNVPTAMQASGLTDVRAGLRLRYDITRNLSPYVGVELARTIGGTATLHRAGGEPVENTRFVFGIRTFF
jgi:copper resistance protein B